jgi:hypothetical protein
MGDQQQQASAGAGTKKPLSDLTKEELIEKCKHFLTLAQKAKAAKDGKLRTQLQADISFSPIAYLLNPLLM